VNTTVSGNFANFGGGIANRGDTFTVADSTFSDNSAAGCTQPPDAAACSGGGGIWNSGTLTISETVFSGNASDFGGAVSDRGVLTLAESRVSENSAAIDGGGVQSLNSATIVDTTVENNAATQSGGGVAVSNGRLELRRSTIVNNSADSAGGGVFVRLGAVAGLTNATLTENSAGRGGGFYSLGDASIASSTFASNESPDGSEIHIASSPEATRAIRNTIVQGDCGGLALQSGGHNLESPGDTCGLDQGSDRSDVTDAELGLGPLMDNGGATETRALESDSVAIDQIAIAECISLDGEPLMEDQRAAPRPGEGSTQCDVGSFEAQ
jgi:hypothetical protein